MAQRFRGAPAELPGRARAHRQQTNEYFAPATISRYPRSKRIPAAKSRTVRRRKSLETDRNRSQFVHSRRRATAVTSEGSRASPRLQLFQLCPCHEDGEKLRADRYPILQQMCAVSP